MLKGILNMHCQWRRCRQLLHMITLLLMCFSLLPLRRCNQAQHLPEPLASVSCVCMWRRDTHALEWFETIKPCKATVRYEPDTVAVIKRAPPEEDQDKGSKRAKVEPGLGAYATPPATPVTSVLSVPRPSSALGRAAHLSTANLMRPPHRCLQAGGQLLPEPLQVHGLQWLQDPAQPFAQRLRNQQSTRAL